MRWYKNVKYEWYRTDRSIVKVDITEWYRVSYDEWYENGQRIERGIMRMVQECHMMNGMRMTEVLKLDIMV